MTGYKSTQWIERKKERKEERKHQKEILVGARFSYSVRPALGPTQLLYSGYRGIPGGKAAGAGVNHRPHLAPRLKKE
jgi:hypothetical protein